MQEHNIKNNDFNSKNCFYQKENYNNQNCFCEKKIIIYLILIALLLFYGSLFFIHKVNYKDNKKDKQLSNVEYNDDNKQNNNRIDNSTINNIKDNNEADNIFNNNIMNENNITNTIINGNFANNVGSGNSQTSNPNEGVNNPGEEINNPGGDTNNPGGETNKPGEGTNNPDEDIVDNKDRFKITQDLKEWKDLKSLNIFNNYYFNGNSIIAPSVHGKYNFTVENYKEAKILYNIKFKENNVYNINMVYKLKLNGAYIAGDEHTYVQYTDLNTEDIVINENSKDIFTLEWKWQDSDNDTQIGKTPGVNYKINIEVNASELSN